MNHEGARGKFGGSIINPLSFFRLPGALKEVFGCQRIALAHDARPSSPELYDALMRGAVAAGLDVYDCGLLPTPIFAKWLYDVGRMGLMVTASHNPVEDNGVKILSQQALTPKQVNQITQHLEHEIVPSGIKGQVQNTSAEVKQHYVSALQPYFIQEKIKVLVDTAHGAWSDHLDIMAECGFSVDAFRPIENHLVNTTGALHVQRLQESYKASTWDYVLAVDGDGDRLQLLDREAVFDGDDILFHLAKAGKAPVVGTVMSNERLALCLAQESIGFARTSVGDFYVRNALARLNGVLGAEPCGHIIDLSWMPWSDPLYTFLQILHQGPIVPLPHKFYQRQMTLSNRLDIEQVKQHFTHPNVRSVIRFSATEPVIRVLLEGDSETVDGLFEGVIEIQSSWS